MQTHFPSGGGPDSGAGLLLTPFRAVRYDLSRVGGLANVTSPPYDVIGPGTLERLRDASPYNVVRLILPTDVPGAAAARTGGEAAAARLRGWLAEGVLAADGTPAFYVYEQRAEGWVQRGLIGLVAVGTDAVHPHEGVMPGPVAGRQELMKKTRSNLEPILLVYNSGAAAGGHRGPAGLEGGLPGGHPSVPPGTASRLTDLTADRQAPLASVATDDGVTHRLWAVTDPAAQAAIAADLATRTALIADGHHRYAAYQQLRDSAGAPGPWDYGLAFLVDSAAYPPRIGAVHRVLPDLPPRQAVSLARSAFTVRPLTGDLPSALRALDAEPGAAFVLAGDDSFWLVSRPSEALDASVLQDLLIGQAWGIEDNERDVQVAHDPDEAVRAVAEGGTAVLSRPIPFDVVRRMAARGERVPRKSTSFGPKPRTGLVLRYWGSSEDSAPTRASSTVL